MLYKCINIKNKKQLSQSTAVPISSQLTVYQIFSIKKYIFKINTSKNTFLKLFPQKNRDIYLESILHRN